MLFSTRMAMGQTDFQKTFPMRKPSGDEDKSGSEYYGVSPSLWSNRWVGGMPHFVIKTTKQREQMCPNF